MIVFYILLFPLLWNIVLLRKKKFVEEYIDRFICFSIDSKNKHCNTLCSKPIWICYDSLWNTWSKITSQKQFDFDLTQYSSHNLYVRIYLYNNHRTSAVPAPRHNGRQNYCNSNIIWKYKTKIILNMKMSPPVGGENVVCGYTSQWNSCMWFSFRQETVHPPENMYWHTDCNGDEVP